jgi:hypothetical protein
MISSRRLRILGGLTATALMLLGRAAPALDSEGAVAAYLAEHPGGQRVGGADIAYDHGRFVVTVVAPPGVAAADCPSGWFCFYDGINFGYPRGRLSDCGWQDLGWWGWRDRTESAAYNLSTGSVVFINETGATDTALFTVGTSARSRADVAPNRNRADYVFRYCS